MQQPEAPLNDKTPHFFFYEQVLFRLLVSLCQISAALLQPSTALIRYVNLFANIGFQEVSLKTFRKKEEPAFCAFVKVLCKKFTSVKDFDHYFYMVMFI